ncbi:hypothetical protein [Brevibacillus agri]|uniref:hypothetical protein n=1 Tax=Brevibacillus agri TaxID=51101 RepID=UPI003D1C1DFD
MIKDKTYFQPSINIRFDLGKGELYERYLPTPTHAESLLGLLKGFLNQGNRAHIISGPYGSGKSLLATLVADIALNGRDAEWFSRLQKKFLTVDSNIYDYLEEIRKENPKYIPVIMSGSGESLRQNLLSSIYRTLHEHGLDFSMPLVVSEVKRVVAIWQSDFIDTFNSLIRLLGEENWTLHTWLSDVENYSDYAIQWFKKVYPKLTSGSQLNVSYDHDIVTQLNHVLGELKQRGYGLFIVYDEFGRFLQTLGSAEVHATMQDLQDLAELSNHNNTNNLSILLITHRNLGQYALRFSEEMHKEFQRIERRYSVYYTQADRATFIRLASTVTQEYRKDFVREEQFVSELRQFGLFPELSYHEIDSLVIKGAYPIHPVSLFAIPQLANLVGQNERTLFTFLESTERGGLKEHTQTSDKWYLVDKIFDYFEPAISEFDKDSLIGQSYLMYNRLRRKLIESEFLEDELKALKIITLWRIANLNARQVLSEDLMSFSLLWESEYTAEVLASLQRKKVIRYNAVNKFWDLFEGSGVDTEGEISGRLQTLSMNKRQKAMLLEEVIFERYILPKQYNDEKSMTRFAAINPVFASELVSGTISSTNLLSIKESDTIVHFIIDDTAQDFDSLKQSMLSLSLTDNRIIYALPVNKLSDEFEPLIERLSIIKTLLQDKYFLSQDRYLLDELNQIKTEVEIELNKMVEASFGSNNCLWINQGTEFTNSKNYLSKYLSKIMMSVFPLTPEVRNESFNRRNVTKVQKSAAFKVVDMIINAENDEQLKIDGFGPDYLIYATVVKNTGINIFSDTINAECLQELKRRLLNVLSNGNGKFNDLIGIFTAPPFGIRKPVVPVLLVALLKRQWKHLMFYNNLIYNPDVNGELLYYMVENPDNYTFTFQKYDSKFDTVLNEVEGVFQEYVKGVDRSLPPAVFAMRILLQWLRDLPKITQSTTKTSVEAKNLLEIIRKGEVEPIQALESLYELLKNNSGVLLRLRNECEMYFSKHKSVIIQHIFDAIKLNTFEDITQWAEMQNDKVKIKNPLIKGILESTEETLVEYLSESIVGVKRENWSDATDNLFISQIEGYLKQVTEDLYQSFIEVRVGDTIHVLPEVSLSEKSRVIYQNAKTNFKLMGRTVPKEEIQFVLLELLKDFLSD